jgi:SAM-dependent methyltransferase
MSTEAAHTYRDRIYRSYDSARLMPFAPDSLDGLQPQLPYLQRIVREQFPENRSSSILDLGCGHGSLLYVLQRCGYSNVRGVDTSPEQVAAAKRLGIGGVEDGDVMETLAITPATSLDVVITFDVIEHFSKSELIPLVDAVLRVLKPGGRWIIHAPNAEGPMFGRVRYGDFTHELAFTRVSLDQLLRASGFARVACFEDSPVPHGLKSAIRALLWFGFRAGLLCFLAVETGKFDRGALFSPNLLAVAIKNGEG